MEKKKTITFGKSVFRELIESNNYYVDKTAFLKPFIEKDIPSVLFTRPRRFGKTLTMDMMKEFFCLNYKNEPDYEMRQKNLFNDLAISQDKEFCDRHMGKYPVISVSFKETKRDDYEDALRCLYTVISKLFVDFEFLLANPKLNDRDRNFFLRTENLSVSEISSLNTGLLQSSLDFLVTLLNKCYKEPVIVLIDEYDVPQQNARAKGFYSKIADIVRLMISPVAKHDSTREIKYCVLTGCLRISKESIFTGLNGTAVYSISSDDYNDLFGFTDTEVNCLLEYYGVSDKKALIKERYDGYNFCGAGIYNPWDVMYYLSDSIGKKDVKPLDYWANTSGNDIILEFVDYSDESMQMALSRFLHGETVAVDVNEQFSFTDLDRDHSATQLFSLLYLSGYLTCVGEDENGSFLLKIPNQEVQKLFEDKIKAYFDELHHTQTENTQKLCDCLLAGDAGGTEDKLFDLFQKYLSVQDTKYEITHHAFVLGRLSDVVKKNNRIEVYSQPESGDGYPDITVSDDRESIAAVLEFKRSESAGRDALKEAAERGLRQIIDKNYVARFKSYKTVWIYGIGCRGKRVAVVADKVTF